MNRKNPYKWLFAGLLLAALTSCIRDETKPCPALTVSLAVKDMNYFNVNSSDSEQPLDENLPFGYYVPTLCYTLRDAATGQVVEQRPLFEAAGDDREYTLRFCPCLPHGTYVLTVWGGIEDDEYIGDDLSRAGLHAEGEEGDDLYLTHDTLVYDAGHYAYRADLERTKGKLIVEARNLPAEYRSMTIRVGNIWSQVSETYDYATATSVTAVHGWDEGAAETVAGVLLAPSAGLAESPLQIELQPAADGARRSLASNPIGVTIRRNELTTVRYEFNGQGGYDIYLKVEAAWEKIYSLDIE